MLFNSLEFAVFLPLVFLVYWLVARKPLWIQNAVVVAASAVFYGWWNWKFLGLIAFSTVLDYTIARLMAGTQETGRRKLLLWISVGANIGLLGFFKYYNFFIDSFVSAFSLFGVSLASPTLNIILPVGISFYTFQTLSYTIDVYRNKMPATNNLLAFAAYVSFFPQLVAGPIERAVDFLPQFLGKRQFELDKAVDGCRQMLWGLAKKVVIADQCGRYVNYIFDCSDMHPGSTLLLGGMLFSIQIYADFSGYSDIAIGAARLFGFSLRRNFAYPFFARDVAEHWRRWHISLSTWFRDYVYIPLGGSRGGQWMSIRNIAIVFLVSGLWHGANWTYVAWGGVHARCLLSNTKGSMHSACTPPQAT